MALYHSMTEMIGETPLLALERLGRQRGWRAEVLAKLEYFNPAGSVKDRAALGMIRAAEEAGRLRSVVTQNIDGLHQAAGSRRVWELHGSVHRNHCMRCGKPYPVEFIRDSKGVPRCSCGSVVKPDVVLYEESLDSRVLEGALADIQSADLLIVGGTSLAVYPAAGLIRYYRGERVVLLNKSPTPYDSQADLVISAPIGQVLEQIKA